jgi:hypothetical protein
VQGLVLRLIMRVASAVLSLAFAGTLLLPVAAQAAPRAQTAQASQSGTDLSAQSRRVRRPPTRIRVYPTYNPDDVYPRYFPGRNAVRDCTATLVEEFRPSGTVITPRMNCFWRPG